MITESSVRTIEPDIKVVTIAGRLNLGNMLLSVEAGVRRLIDEGCRKLILDLANLAFIDSAGVGLLITCNGLMERAGGQYRIAGAHGIVAQVFETVHMGRVVPMDADVEAARGNFSATGT
ncbi:MAG: STAS domain-containing protein [Acidobacteriota bacterium]|nr:STAS domain-containing protein [Acidobacteriota bacterium]